MADIPQPRRHFRVEADNTIRIISMRKTKGQQIGLASSASTPCWMRRMSMDKHFSDAPENFRQAGNKILVVEDEPVGVSHWQRNPNCLYFTHGWSRSGRMAEGLLQHQLPPVAETGHLIPRNAGKQLKAIADALALKVDDLHA